MYEALGVKDIDQVLPPPPAPQAMDPGTENILALNGKKIQAFPQQDHQAHMKSHLLFMGTTICRNNPQALGILQQNCMEHIVLMAQEHVELEYKEQMEGMQKLQEQIQPILQQQQANPQMQLPPNVKQIQEQAANLQVAIEARKSTLIAEFMEDYSKAEKETLNQIDGDPLLKLKDRELDIKAREDQAQQQQAEEKLNLERSKMLQNKELAEEKMQENDKHQKLRAAVSLAKDGIKDMKANILEKRSS